MMIKKNLLISKCLLGENVRYDGGNCLIDKNQLIILHEKFNLISICPEVMAGMSVPREPIELLNDKIINKSLEDLTVNFEPVKSKLKDLIASNSIEFALLKENSPSCGVHHIYDGSFSGNIVLGTGLIAKFLTSLNIRIYSENEIQKLIIDIEG